MFPVYMGGQRLTKVAYLADKGGELTKANKGSILGSVRGMEPPVDGAVCGRAGIAAAVL